MSGFGVLVAIETTMCTEFCNFVTGEMKADAAACDAC